MSQPTNATVEVLFEPSERSVRVPVGTSLLDAARRAGEQIDAVCDGQGLCGACQVQATGLLSAVTLDEQKLLGRVNAAEGVRLACRVRALGDVVVRCGAPSGVAHSVYAASVQTSPAANDTVAAQQAGLRSLGQGPLGAAVDIGTTTVAVSIVDLETKLEVSHAGALNPQIAYGADVMSRVASALNGREAELRALIVERVERLILEALSRASAATSRLSEIVIVGNTAMLGLFLGHDLAPLAEAPYENAPIAAEDHSAAEMGMNAVAHTSIHILPSASAFLGADVVAGMLSAGITRREGPTLFVDIGTNGEIVLVSGQDIVATSTASGPALEGATLSAGMRAEEGAIERVALEEGELVLGIIGDTTPRGICGSGVIDLLSVLLDEGVIDSSGLLVADAPSPLCQHVVTQDGVRAFLLADHVSFTQLDIRQAQLAIAAIRAGIDSVFDKAGLRPSNAVVTLIAGGFGRCLDPAAILRTGLVPAPLTANLTFVGNAALAGAKAALGRPDIREYAKVLARQIRVFDLAQEPSFEAHYLTTLSGVFTKGFDIRHN